MTGPNTPRWLVEPPPPGVDVEPADEAVPDEDLAFEQRRDREWDRYQDRLEHERDAGRGR